jgi:hypothetical protein
MQKQRDAGAWLISVGTIRGINKIYYGLTPFPICWGMPGATRRAGTASTQ